MKVKGIVDEDFSNYKKPSMFISSCYCNYKCCHEAHIPITVCQNQPIAQQSNLDIPIDEIFNRYINNNITNAIVFGGLEWILQFDEMIECIEYFRQHDCKDDIVVYTGYYPNEITQEINHLKQYENIIVKFGRYKPNHQPHYDEVLGVELISKNQWGEKL